MQAAWGTVFLSLGGGLLMLHKARFPKLRYGWDVALLTYAVVSVPGACLRARKYAVHLVPGARLCVHEVAIISVPSARLCARRTTSGHANSGIDHVRSDWPATALSGLLHVHPMCSLLWLAVLYLVLPMPCQAHS